MGLRSIANADLAEIMNDTETGGDPVTITSPDGEAVEFMAICNDIYQSLDPGTGTIVSGRVCSASVLLSELINHGFDGIRGVEDSDSAPWLVTVTDVVGREYTMKVREANPDAHLGLVPLLLEEYET